MSSCWQFVYITADTLFLTLGFSCFHVSDGRESVLTSNSSSLFDVGKLI
jgi:hypothetical protein